MKCTRCGAISSSYKHICSNIRIAKYNVEYTIVVFSLPDGGYKVEVLELPIATCTGHTVESAVEIVKMYAIEWLDNTKLSGLDMPKQFNLNMDQHNPKMRTICEVLREIHQSNIPDDIKSKALEAMIMAKKMDARLRYYKKDYDINGWWESLNGG